MPERPNDADVCSTMIRVYNRFLKFVGLGGEKLEKGAILAGEIDEWPTKTELAHILRSVGFNIVVGKYSIQMKEFDVFSFQELGGELCAPLIVADRSSTDALAEFSKRISDVLGRNELRHRFEIYNSAQQMVYYFHHNWPMKV